MSGDAHKYVLSLLSKIIIGKNNINRQCLSTTLTITFNISEIAMHHVGKVHQIGALGQTEEDKHENRNVRSAKKRCHLFMIVCFLVIAGNFVGKE